MSTTRRTRWFRRPWQSTRDRWRRAGLRDRVLVLVMIVLLISCAVLFGATTLALRHFLVKRLDEQVNTAAATLGHSISHPDHDGAGGFNTEGQAPGTLGALVVNGHVTSAGVVQGYAAPRPLSAAASEVVQTLKPKASVQATHLPGLGAYRVMVRQDGPTVLVVGLPVNGVDDTIGDLALIEGVVFLVVLGITAVVGRRLVFVSLHPLRALTRTAREVSDLPLDVGDVRLHARVPDPAPGTEVGEVAQAFNHMLDHVDSAFAARHRSESRLRQFAADASHELRTPVAIIRGRAEYALEDAGASVESLERIQAEAIRTGTLVDNLLLLARLDAGQAVPHDELDLSLTVLEVVDDIRLTAPQHRWQMDLPDEPVLVHGDADALRRALSNLISNAARHTPPGTTVTVTVAETADHVRLEVADDGPGIPPELAANVFERFVRGDDARVRESGSTGLGLAIVAAIATTHGGSVTVDSAPGRTVFTVLLPQG